MTKTEYMSIRGEPDFIYRYFKKVSGSNIDHHTFYSLLAAWIGMLGERPRSGQIKIIKFLDRKFAQ